MFRIEAQMTPSAKRWMEKQGLRVKAECVSPWGICDLVGAKLDRAKITERLQLGQRRPIGNALLVALLMRVPDIETGKSITIDRLYREFSPVLTPEEIRKSIDRLARNKFIEHRNSRCVYKRNGWAPLHERIVAIELKLDRIDEAFHQAAANLAFSTESYAAFPAEVAERVHNNCQRWSRHLSKGIGLLSVSSKDCSISIPAKPERNPGADKVLQNHVVEKFWREAIKDSSS